MSGQNQLATAAATPRGAKFFSRRFEIVTALVLTAAAAALHLRYFLSAGALWRDEVNSIQIAASRTFGQMLANLHNDSFPVLWLSLVRLWQGCGLGDTDRSIRVLGLAAGLATVAALWRNARKFGLATPVVSLALLTFTSSTICFGDSIRGYGMGMFLGVLTIGCIWGLTQAVTARSLAEALIVALLAVHMLFYNGVVLLAACAGAAAVTAAKRQPKRTVQVLGIGLVCATTMLVYIPMIQRIREMRMFQQPHDSAWIVARLRDALRFQPDGNVAPGVNDIVWAGAATAGIGFAVAAWLSGAMKGASQRRRDLTIFCGVGLIVGLAGYWAFLRLLGYLMHPWYFLAAMAMTAAFLDGLFCGIDSPHFRILLTAYAAGLAVYSAQPLWQNVGARRTNIDVVAAELQRSAKPGDLIVLAPWYNAVSFHRYYHGPVQWTTAPPVGFVDYQRYELLIPFIRDPGAVDPLIEDLIDVLKAGHRVWVVGDDWFPPTPPPGPTFQTEPDARQGWRPAYYETEWDRQVCYALRHESKNLWMPPIWLDQPVSGYESVHLTAIWGWKGN